MIKLSPADIARCQAIAAQHKGPIRKMMEQVAAETGVPVARIIGKHRDQTTVEARQLCMYLAVCAGFSRPQIGAAMGRDQSTVTHGYQAEKARRAAAKCLQVSETVSKIDGPGGVTSAHPGPDHRQSEKETARMADEATIPIPGQKAIPEASAR